jgi:hypothetical protein
MKKIIVFLLGAVFLLTGTVAAFSADNDKAGDVVSIRGNAVVERKSKELEAEKKLVLLEMDNVTTREKSRLKMLFRDDSILTLGALSRLSVSQYLYSPADKRSESVYELLDGKLRAVVGNANLSVKTPTAFAAARGTIFVIWYDPVTNTTTLAVLEGSVLIKNVDGSVGGEQTLSAGQMTKVAGNNPPSLPESFQIINMTGPATGRDIGPIVYEVTLDGIPEIAFIDNWRGDTEPPEFFDWDDDRLPRILFDDDTYRPGSSWLIPSLIIGNGNSDLIDG